MGLTITNLLVIEEAKKVGIDHEVISDSHNLLLLKYKGESKLIRRSRIPCTSIVSGYIADNKGATYEVAEHYGFSYPKYRVVKSLEEAIVAAEEIGYPIVVKPEEGHRGQGVSINIKKEEELKDAFERARAFNEDEIIVQKFFPGNDYRILVIGYKVFAVAHRIPARVFGDGELTIKELIEKENENPLRKGDHTSPMSEMVIDPEMERFLESKGLTVESVPQKEEIVEVLGMGNMSGGGEAVDLTDEVPQENKDIIEDIAKAIDSNLTGIDIRCEDIVKPFTSDNYAIIEANSSPGIRMHYFPSKGKKRNAALEILKQLFPQAFENEK